jgi:hypothetical protein
MKYYNFAASTAACFSADARGGWNMFCCRTIRVAFWRYGICHPPAPPGGQHRLARLPERQPYSLPVSRRTSSPTCPARQSDLHRLCLVRKNGRDTLRSPMKNPGCSAVARGEGSRLATSLTNSASGHDSPCISVRAFAERLRELGWIEGRTIAIEYRWSKARPERIADNARQWPCRARWRGRSRRGRRRAQC